MIVQKEKDGILIVLSRPFDSRVKMLDLFHALLSFCMGSIFLIFIIIGIHNHSSIEPASILVIILIYFISFRFLNKAVLSEKIRISSNSMFLIRKRLYKTDHQLFDIRNIRNIHYLEKEEIALRPLAGQTLDLFGFNANAKLINQLNVDNQLQFEYEGKLIAFGSDIYSYEFDEIKQIIETQAATVL